MSETVKRPPWLKDVSQCLRWSGRDRNWFSAQGFEKFGKDPTDGRKSLYDVREVCARAMGFAFLSDGDDVPNKAEEDARLTKARRVAQELDNAERTGELAPLDVMSAQYRSDLTALAALLDAVPMQVKRAWPEVPGVVIDEIDRNLAKMRNDFATKKLETARRDSTVAEISENAPA